MTDKIKECYENNCEGFELDSSKEILEDSNLVSDFIAKNLAKFQNKNENSFDDKYIDKAREEAHKHIKFKEAVCEDGHTRSFGSIPKDGDAYEGEINNNDFKDLK